MRYVHLLQGRADPETRRVWAADRRAGHSIGVLTLGARCLYFRKGWTIYAVPYERIGRYFRRVLAVPARIGCCGGELRMEHLVICGPDGAERAQVQLPGERAARAVMEELRRLAPDAVSGRPPQPHSAAVQADGVSDSADAVQTDAAQTDGVSDNADAAQADSVSDDADAAQTDGVSDDADAVQADGVSGDADAVQTDGVSGDADAVQTDGVSDDADAVREEDAL